MTVSNICILGTIAVYLVGMLIIGFRCARKNESSADFYLGGRKLGPLVTAMSAEASDMSSYLLMGLPGLAYLSGVADVGWTIPNIEKAGIKKNSMKNTGQNSPFMNQLSEY